jgi:hypothetical protein
MQFARKELVVPLMAGLATFAFGNGLELATGHPIQVVTGIIVGTSTAIIVFLVRRSRAV